MLCLLAVWSKQTALFLIPAHVLGLLLLGGRATAVRYIVIISLLGLLSLIIMGAVFGYGPLWLNLVSIPAHLPWGDLHDKIDRRWLQLLAMLVVPALLAFMLLRRRWRNVASVHDRLLLLGLLAFLAQLPTGLLAFAKVGGDINALSAWYYLLPSLALGSLAWLTSKSQLWLALFVAALLTCRAPDFINLPHTPATHRLLAAERLATAFPGTIWFPHNPLVTYYTDHRLYHVEDGIATRHLAGFSLREKEFRRYLPASLGAIVYPSEQQNPFALQLIPEFSANTTAGPWRIFTRPTQ